MFTITKEFRFEASHILTGHDGKCARLHGHSWRGRVIVQKGALIASGPKEGMVMDFGDITRALKPLIEERLDHWHLNVTLEMERPTSERVAHWLFQQLRPSLPGLLAVEIDETCTSSARYEIA